MIRAADSRMDLPTREGSTRFAKTLLVSMFVLSLADAGIAAGAIKEVGKIPVSKAGDPTARSSQGLLDCSDVWDIELRGNSTVIHGTTVGATNNVSTYGCSPWNESGGEVIFRVVFPDDASWQVNLSGMSADLDLAVLDVCDELLGCLIVVDNGVYTSEPVPGEHFLVVDGYNGACGPYIENGLEHLYEILVPAGGSFTANVTYDTADGALWVLDRCYYDYICLGFADDTLEGELETVTYTNSTDAAQAMILVLDSWGTASCGTYQFEIVSDCAVAAEVSSFGGVKASFR